MTASPERVVLVDVTARDGLQDEPRIVGTARKAELVAAVAAAGIAEIEATSFVHPRRVPQLADAEALVPLLPRGVRYSALIMNERGFERGLAAFGAAGFAPGSYDLVFVASASPRHNAANNNRTIPATLAYFDTIATRARAAGVTLRATISCSFVSPWADETIALGTVREMVARFAGGGCAMVALADTIGKATPEQVDATLAAVRGVSDAELSLHFHDLHGSAIRNVEAGLRRGVRRFEGVLAGIGGCPFAPDAPGNLDLETLAGYVESRGFATGVDAARLGAARAVLQRALDDAEPLPVAHAAAG
ncbi:MAG TPA: hydroxymethylglutaryl-CoA lyase [Candidatus Elarobacter sp.]|jgi:hydroxymethylglutaryl-CoA lyase|nr:hydroxymethylglutaryl-CoA lyase [Candidatus Elarobacter sp.]